MIYVIFRTIEDAQIDKTTGTACITHLRTYPVDDTILPHGAIVLKTVQVSSPVYHQIVDNVQVGTDGKAFVLSSQRVPHRRKVLEEKKGESGRPDDKVYVCEATEADADYLSKVRGWRWLPFPREDQIPRVTDVPDGTPEVEEALPQTPDGVAEMEMMKLTVKLLMKAGAPKIKLSRGPTALREYIALHSENYANGTDGDGDTAASEPVVAEATG